MSRIIKLPVLSEDEWIKMQEEKDPKSFREFRKLEREYDKLCYYKFLENVEQWKIENKELANNENIKFEPIFHSFYDEKTHRLTPSRIETEKRIELEEKIHGVGYRRPIKLHPDELNNGKVLEVKTRNGTFHLLMYTKLIIALLLIIPALGQQKKYKVEDCGIIKINVTEDRYNIFVKNLEVSDCCDKARKLKIEHFCNWVGYDPSQIIMKDLNNKLMGSGRCRALLKTCKEAYYKMNPSTTLKTTASVQSTSKFTTLGLIPTKGENAEASSKTKAETTKDIVAPENITRKEEEERIGTTQESKMEKTETKEDHVNTSEIHRITRGLKSTTEDEETQEITEKMLATESVEKKKEGEKTEIATLKNMTTKKIETESEVKFVTKGECKGKQIMEPNIHLINDMELCIMKCMDGNFEILGFDWRDITDPTTTVDDCWSETKEDFLSIGDNQDLHDFFSTKGYRGTKTIHICGFSNCGKSKGEIVSTIDVWVHQEPVILKVCQTCRIMSLPKQCKVDVRHSYTDVSITMKGSYGSYRITLDKQTFRGFFKNERTEIATLPGPGVYELIGSCNDIQVHRMIAITADEFCDEKYGTIYDAPWRVYCKNNKTINTLVIVILIFLAFYFLKNPLSHLLAATIAIIISLSLMFFKKKIICNVCSKLCFFQIAHRCVPTRCVYCQNIIISEESINTKSTEELKAIMRNHQNERCKKIAAKGEFVLCIINFYRLLAWFFINLFSRIPAIGTGICIIWILSIILPGASGIVISENKDENINKNVDSEIDEDLKNNRDFCVYIPILGTSLWLLLLGMSIALSPIIAKLKSKIYKSKGFKICEYCLEYNTERDPKKRHKCDKAACPHCGLIMGFNNTENIGESILIKNIVHRENCNFSDIHPSRSYTRKYLKNVNKSAMPVLVIILLVSLLLTINCVNGEYTVHDREMEKLDDDLSEFIKDIVKEGFHPYHARFTPGRREKISAIYEKRLCTSGKCELQMELEADIYVRKGREFGYRVCPKGDYRGIEKLNCPELNIKLLNPRYICSYKLLYKTGRSLHHQTSRDTCTQSCSKCKEALEIKQDNGSEIIYREHENTASWSCDGPGCIAINQGCTCGACWCEVKNPNWMVMELVKEYPHFSLCVQAGSQGYCKDVSREEIGTIVKVMKYDSRDGTCPKLIAIENQIDVYTGEINNLGEFDNKFGSVQVIGTRTAVKEETRYTEHCLFAKHRWMTFQQCCKDTFNYHEMLEHTNLKKLQDGADMFSKNVDNIGTWKLRIQMPKLHYLEQEDKLRISDLSITNCHGCYNCKEGGSCLLNYKLNLISSIKFTCDNCVLDHEYLTLEPGSKSKPFNVFCNKQSGEINCKIGNLTVKGLYSLLDKPKFPHGDGVINIDPYKSVEQECEGFFCFFNVNWFGGMRWIYWIVTIIVVILIVYIIIKSVLSIRSFFKKIA